MFRSVLWTGATILVGALGWVSVGASTAVGSNGRLPEDVSTGSITAQVSSSELAAGHSCEAQFARHELAHVTRAADSPARLFDSNGSGVAADDLDGDGLADIVLGNLEGPNTILWNDGDWTFTRAEMSDRATRSIGLVDVDADGKLDIVTTHRGSGVAVFRNLGGRRFEQLLVRGVGAPAYSMAWGDVDVDGDLDLVTGSYDAELDQQLRSTFLFGDGAGIHLYENDGTGTFDGRRLAPDAQALVTALFDLDHDGALDILIGNDFEMRDMVWTNDGAGRFSEAAPFEHTSEHTMSLDAGDIDGDAIEEIFATDMRPASSSTAVLAEWLPLMATMDESDDPAEPQRIRNVLQASSGDGTYREVAQQAGVEASGWAWSGRFGDLDNDRDMDLYVVNGMIAVETFEYLPRAELSEANVAYANRGDGRFDVADWSLDAMESGRGSVIVDLDDDGRLDVVVNNLDDSAVAFENRLCGGRAIAFALRQPGTGNTHAVGARISVHTPEGVQVRTIRSVGGYLSGSPSTVHFGLGDTNRVDEVEVRWPDGTTSTIGDLEADHVYEVTKP